MAPSIIARLLRNIIGATKIFLIPGNHRVFKKTEASNYLFKLFADTPLVYLI